MRPPQVNHSTMHVRLSADKRIGLLLWRTVQKISVPLLHDDGSKFEDSDATFSKIVMVAKTIGV